MADSIQILEVITPNARDLQGGAQITLELPLSRALTEWERLALRGQNIGHAVEIEDACLRFTPRGPHKLPALLSAVADLPAAARALYAQHEATAAQALENVRADLAATSLTARQARDYGEGMYGPR